MGMGAFNFRLYVLNVLVGFDQLANAIFGGDPDETISSRAAKDAERGGWVGTQLCNCLDVLDPGHCQRVVERDEGTKASWK